ncbi:hypothetical protein EON65_40265 [archaeon]|nr:MAG: hypothetical protein EON65_40265 [archaeon]
MEGSDIDSESAVSVEGKEVVEDEGNGKINDVDPVHIYDKLIQTDERVCSKIPSLQVYKHGYSSLNEMIDFFVSALPH